jgi:hypothetical protein
MGCYDTFWGYWRCPDCNCSGEVDVQTKALECQMNHYHIGDEIVYEPIERESSFTVKAQHYCWRCRPKQDCFSIIRCKSAKYKSWEVLIIIEENKFK